MKLLVACEESQAVCKEFRKKDDELCEECEQRARMDYNTWLKKTTGGTKK